MSLARKYRIVPVSSPWVSEDDPSPYLLPFPCPIKSFRRLGSSPSSKWQWFMGDQLQGYRLSDSSGTNWIHPIPFYWQQWNVFQIASNECQVSKVDWIKHGPRWTLLNIIFHQDGFIYQVIYFNANVFYSSIVYSGRKDVSIFIIFCSHLSTSSI